ncbi:unnamed protein product [Brassica oleracea]
MASPKRSWSLSLMPPEIIQEIFYKTPAEALVRAKPTGKEWYALLTDASFINEHFQRSKEHFIRIFDTVKIMDPVTATSSVSPIPNELLQHPYTIHNLVYTLMVHCDGLMLVGYRGWKYRSDGSRISNLALWNPVLKNLRWVEPPVETITSTDYFGIGYNSDGYKIVRFTTRPFEVECCEDVPEVEIYEFKTSSWRTIGGEVDTDVEITSNSVAVMGNMYWTAYRVETPEEEFIRVFDFSDETFKDICFSPTSYVNSHLSCFNGDNLSLLQQDQASRNIEVWVSSKLGDGDVTFSRYFSLSRPDLLALRVRDDANPVYCFVKPKSVIVWCVEVEGKGTVKACTCCTLYEIGEDGVKSKRETERSYVRDYSRAFRCGYVYIPSMIPLPWIFCHVYLEMNYMILLFCADVTEHDVGKSLNYFELNLREGWPQMLLFIWSWYTAFNVMNVRIVPNTVPQAEGFGKAKTPILSEAFGKTKTPALSEGLDDDSLLGYIDSSTPRPLPTVTTQTGELVTEAANPEFAKWMRRDQLVMSWLFGSLTEDALRSVYGLHLLPTIKPTTQLRNI